MAANFLYVQTHNSKDPRVELPYHELMPFRVYLTTVLAPAFHSTIKDNGCTVADCFRYISDDLCIRVRFDREHRNERLGNFIPPGATLTRTIDASLSRASTSWNVENHTASDTCARRSCATAVHSCTLHHVTT